MLSHTYATDSQTKSTELAATITAATSPPQISAACTAIESFLTKRSPDQTRWFFSITFPTLICKLFGFDESPTRKPNFPNGWIDVVSASNDSELAARVFSLLSPNGVLMSSIGAVDRLCLVKYVFPNERLPEWVRFMLQNERDCRVLADLCPLFKGKITNKVGASYQVQLNVFEYYMFWFAYYPVCKGNSENCDAVKVRRSKRFRLENWGYSIPGFGSNVKRGREEKSGCSLYVQILYAYLNAYVPVSDLTAPYRSSLLHYMPGYDDSVLEHAEFLVYTLVHFWLVDNDFSPLPVNVCKSFGVNFPFRSVLGETPPTPGLGEVVDVFVKYLNLSSTAISNGSDKVESTESPRWRVSGSVDVKSRDVGFRTVGTWNSWIQRPLYRFILRTFIYCPMETSIKNVSQVFSLWINYIEPWTVRLEDFAGLDANAGISSNNNKNENTRSPSCGYSSSWQGYVLINYMFYSSLVMHFFGFAHKFVHTDTEVIMQMVSKVLNVLTSSKELTDLIKNVDTVFHTKPASSSRSTLSNLYRFVPSIREQLQDWEDGLCENDADGSFLHENWNKDLQLFSDSEDGGQQLLQLFVLRAESELQAFSGDNLAHNLRCLDSLKTQMGCLFGNSTVRTPPPVSLDPRENQHPRDDIFSPRMAGSSKFTDVKYKGDWMKRPISSDEIEWLAKLLVTLSNWMNKSLGLNQREMSCDAPACSYVEVSGDTTNVCGASETSKLVLCTIGAWLISVGGASVKFMRGRGMRVNLRMLASKKIVTILLVVAVLSALKRAITA